jgi:hypothetical protein
VSKLILIQVVIFCLVLGMGGCGQSSSSASGKWTTAQKENVVHFVNSLNLLADAAVAGNELGPGVKSEQEVAPMIALYERALLESEAVSEEVLDKVHPQLRQMYRSKFQEGIKLRLHGWKSISIQSEIDGSRLLDDWGEWYMANREKLVVPKS